MLTISAAFRHIVLPRISAEFLPDPGSFCADFLPQDSADRAALQSLLCGQAVSDGILLLNLRQTALLHLFVVSGAHLILIEQMLLAARLPVPLRTAAGLAFTLVTGAQPPIVRALLGLWMPHERSRWGPADRGDLRVLKAGLLTLALIPAWVHSMSLALSWGCALAISLPLGSGWRGALRRTLAVWAVLMPLLAPWSVLPPLTWLINLVVAPVFAALSLPAGLVALAGGVFGAPFAAVMAGFTWVLDRLAPELATGAAPVTLWPPAFRWAWIGAWHAAVHAGAVAYGRRRR